MEYLFAWIFLISFVGLMVGLIKPKIVMRWGNEDLKTRKNVLKYFGITAVVFFVLLSITIPKTETSNTNVQSQADSKTDEDTTSEEETKETEAEQPKEEVKVEETKVTQTTLGEMKIHYIDVGQGDSELIQVDGKNILIDAGTSDKKALNYLKSIGITTLDYLVSTHPHEDHLGSMDDVINSFNIGTFYAPKVTANTKAYENMINSLKAKNLGINVPKVNDILTIGNATLTFLAPNSEGYKDVNNTSISVRLKYGNNSFIFMGDAEDLSEGEILAKQLDIQSDVLKVGHHGSDSSTTQSFLDKVNPKYAIISCGKGNDYGHPRQVTLDKLNSKNISIFRTDLQSTIIATSNGTEIKFNTNPVDKASNVAGTKKEESANNNSNSGNATPQPSSGGSSSSSGNSTTTNEPAQGNRTVYWTSGGKSYHYNRSCSTLSRSKNIQEGSASSCPKTDPCDKCAK